MKLFDRFIKKNKKPKSAEFLMTIKDKNISGNLLERSIDVTDKSQREQFILTNCEQMVKSSRIVEGSKAEYQQIVSSLSDIQQIENLPEEQKNEIIVTARNISRINRERKKYQTSENPITDGQYLHFEKFEEEIPLAIRELDKKERFQREIKSDMQHLEGEKGTLSHRRKEMIQSQMNMKGMSMIAFITLIIVFLILIAAKLMFQLNTQIGYLVSISAAGLAAISIFLRHRWNIRSIRNAELAINKAIHLLNRVKIKYVNVTNEIDYIYEKYRVHSSYEFNYLWQMYISEKNQREKYNKTSKELELYSEELILKLEQFNMKEPVMWLHHSDIISDSKKMNKLRRELQEKERSLRKIIDDNLEQAERAKKRITDFVNTYGEYGKETLELVNSVDSIDGIC